MNIPEAARDARLSLEARGCLMLILSHGPDFEFKLEWLIREQGVGRERAYRIICELVDRGYCVRTPVRVGGRHAGLAYRFHGQAVAEAAS